MTIVTMMTIMYSKKNYAQAATGKKDQTAILSVQLARFPKIKN
jgi:hypothetical protein